MVEKVVVLGFVALGTIGCGDHVCTGPEGPGDQCFVSRDRCGAGTKHDLEDGDKDGSSTCFKLGYKKRTAGGAYVKR
jgi:hypothetical protein